MTSPAQWPPQASLDGPHDHRAGARGPARWAPREDLRAGAYLVLALAVLGVLLGVIWQWWSPAGGLGYVVAPHAIQPDETEAFIAGDGRFAVIATATGLLAGGVTWLRTSIRGPVTALALGLGGLLGSWLTGVVGHLMAGGTGNGKTNTLLRQLPLSVHMHGLLLLEAAGAVLVYSLCASFAARDDLGRPEPGEPSVGVRDEIRGPAGHREDTAALHQPYSPPQ
ncbi:MAG: hypothetical protein ABR604_06210 [Jatrophihabitantaceae bacterium]